MYYSLVINMATTAVTLPTKFMETADEPASERRGAGWLVDNVCSRGQQSWQIFKLSSQERLCTTLHLLVSHPRVARAAGTAIAATIKTTRCQQHLTTWTEQRRFAPSKRRRGGGRIYETGFRSISGTAADRSYCFYCRYLDPTLPWFCPNRKARSIIFVSKSKPSSSSSSSLSSLPAPAAAAAATASS